VVYAVLRVNDKNMNVDDHTVELTAIAILHLASAEVTASSPTV
jgi:hypothetical protein